VNGALLNANSCRNGTDLQISKYPAARSIRKLLHVVTLLTFTVGGSIGLLVFFGHLTWIPALGILLISLAGVAGVSLALCTVLTLYLSFSERHKKQQLKKYADLVQGDPAATLPENPSEKLLNHLNNEWETASWFALMQPASETRKTIMADCFVNLQRCKFAHEWETFCRFLKKDLTEGQRQKVEELKMKAQKKFDDEMQTLASPMYATRARYGAMVDFFIILENDMMQAAIEAGLTDCKLPLHEPKIGHLSMSGGGARGYAYGKMLEKLKDFLTPNCRFSGTSAGAIAALAAALNLGDFDGLILEMQKRYNRSSRDNRELATAYGWLISQFASWPSYYDLTGVLALLDQRVQEKISAFLKDISDNAVNAAFSDDPEAAERVRLLREPYDSSVSREGKMLTFQDLDLLRKLPGGLEQFHDFATAIWDKTEQKLIFAKKETQPDMPVVLAVYASMSIPLAFKFLSVPLGKSDEKIHQLCDGGYGTNLPLHAYDDARDENPTDGEIVGAVFDCDGWGGRTIRGNVKVLPKYIRRIARLLGIAPTIEDYIRDERERLKQNLKKLVILPHGDLGILSFDFSEAERRAIDHQVGLRMDAWKICKTRGTNWPEGIWPMIVMN
jgi:predicted acylesterase/phospholipase RssA